MKRAAICMAVLLAALAGRAAFTVGDGKVPDFDKYRRLEASVRHHVREVRADYDTIPGSVIHWYSDGCAETNVIRRIDLVVVTNTVERRIEALSGELARAWSSYTNQLVQTAAYSNACAAATAKIQDEIADLEAKIEKYREYQTRYPLVKSLFAAMIADAENRIRILRALTGGQ